MEYHRSVNGPATCEREQGRLPTILLVLALLVGFSLRLLLLFQPQYAQVQYEEAEFGLIALNILKGKPALFLWGSPYHGVLECYLVALLFRLFGVSTFVLRLEPYLMSCLHMVVLTWVARRFWNRWTAVYTAWFLTVPPLYLATYAALVYPSYLGVVILASLACVLLILILTEERNRDRRLFWLGIVCGLAFWEHATSIPPLLWIGFALLATSPAWFTPRRCGLLLLGVFLGGLPLWTWNMGHHFNTFRCLFGGYGAVATPYTTWRITDHILTWILPCVGGVMVRYWDSDVGAGFWRLWYRAWYLPIVVCWLKMPFAQARLWYRERRISRIRPEIVFLGLLVTVLAVNIASHRTTDRYSFNIYSAWPLLVAVCLDRISGWRRWLGPVILVALLVLHGNDQLRFFMEQLRIPPADRRPVDQVVSYLDRHGIRFLYGHFRVARVVTFETAERIIGADFHGYKMRMYELFEGDLSTPRGYLQEVDNAPPARKAILTDHHLGLPYPREMDRYLACLNAACTRHSFRHQVVYHDFRDPYPVLEPILPDRWQATASVDGEDAGRAFDRTVDSSWHVPPGKGTFFQLDLGGIETVARIVLQAGVRKGHDYPAGVRLDVSEDGRNWREIRPAHDNLFHLFPGFDWLNGTPRLTMNGGTAIVLPRPCRCRFLRLTAVEPRGRWYWTIDEIHCYRPVPGKGIAARDRQAVARWLLRHPVGGRIYAELEEAPFIRQSVGGKLKIWNIYDVEQRINRQRRLAPDQDNLFVIPVRHGAMMARVAAMAGARWRQLFRAGGLAVCRLEADGTAGGGLYWSNEGLLLRPR